MEDEIKIPGGAKDRIVKEVHERIEASKAKGMLMEQALSEITPWLEEQDEIEGVSSYRETDLTLRFVDGSRVGILLGRDQAYGPPLGGLLQAYGPPPGDLQETKGGDAPEESVD